MQVYLVGGAVRDKLLNLAVKDRDWLVTGATPQQMVEQGFQSVGRDFPVFLHPKTKEEYALARTERKQGHGYHGFHFYTAPTVTLEEDLLRRDLTINAMAESEQGELIDPYGGQQDLEQRVLRHVSPAFEEDPLRVLRVARFYARLQYLGFTVAPETLMLMQQMVANGEVAHLVAERVWQESHQALLSSAPQAYFELLQQCGALAVVMPELVDLLTEDVLAALQQAAQQQQSDLVRFGCLFLQTSPEQQPQLKSFAARLRLPTAFAELMLLMAKQHDAIMALSQQLNAEALMALFEGCDAFRRGERFDALLQVMVMSGLSADFVENLQQWLVACESIKAQDVMSNTVKGKAIGEALRQVRLVMLQTIITG